MYLCYTFVLSIRYYGLSKFFWGKNLCQKWQRFFYALTEILITLKSLVLGAMFFKIVIYLGNLISGLKGV